MIAPRTSPGPANRLAADDSFDHGGPPPGGSVVDTSRSRLGDRLGFAGFMMGLLCLVFLLGVTATVAELPPSGLVRDAMTAARALLERQSMLGETYTEWLWSPAIRPGRGLVRHDRGLAFPGYTLYTSGHGGVAVLVDMEGNEVHRWDVPFREVWPHAKHVNGGVPDDVIHIRRAHVFPNGDLLAIYETPLDTPFGYGLAKLDRRGRVIWTYDANAHHEFCVADDGTIYVLTHEIRATPVPGWKNLRPPVFEEFIAILSPDGRELKKFSLFDALRGTSFVRPKTLSPSGDVFHCNTVHLVGQAFASHHDAVSAGDLMLCLRHANLVVVVDPHRETAIWATTGPWHFPHDPEPLDNGRILVFDNCFSRGAGGGSRVVEFDPADGTIHWQFAGSEQEPLRSDVRSGSELLPNGNVLVTESDYGRILEVTREGRIVWEHVNPVRGGEDDELIPVVCGVRRYTAGELPFLEKGASASSR